MTLIRFTECKHEAAPLAIAGALTPRAAYPPPHGRRRWGDGALAAGAPVATPASAAATHPPAPGPGAMEEAPYRVLIAEDDASQALFAEGVLRGAGIEARAVRSASEVMPEMERFQPDLVLMDLHMPGMSGTDLTTVIRAHPDFAHTPIVFLTGDPDPERQFEALEVGADDFLSKPIRPRHLIAAVQSRIKRARAMRQRQHRGEADRHPGTGLHQRPFLLQLIATAIAADDIGGTLLVEIQNANALRERYGYAGFEQLMSDAGRRVAELAGSRACARLNDNGFLVLATACDSDQLQAFARGLRDGISSSSFDCDATPQRLRAVIGCGALAHFADPGSLLDALEQAARAGRTDPIGIVTHVPAASQQDTSSGLLAAMRTGLHEGAFELAFQPIVAVAGGEGAQFQALLRMRGADGTLHRASALVPAAEAGGLMPEIDRWVLDNAIELLRRRCEEVRSLRLFVSQSPRTLEHAAHAEWLLEALAEHRIDGPSLVIDLRMDDALVHTVTLRRFCDLLMPAGVQFCLSQYVHGPEADAILQQLPLGYLRLSPRYSSAHGDPQLRDALRGVIERAHRLGLQVIGPQVEDPQAAATLWMSGIDLIQGNLVQEADDGLDFDFAHAVL